MRYSTNKLRCEPSCLFGQTPSDVHDLIGVLHPTLSHDVFGHITEGWISFVEIDGSSGPVVYKMVDRSVYLGSGGKPLHPYQLLWCAIYFDKDVGYYRPRFLTKEGIDQTLK